MRNYGSTERRKFVERRNPPLLDRIRIFLRINLITLLITAIILLYALASWFAERDYRAEQSQRTPYPTTKWTHL